MHRTVRTPPAIFRSAIYFIFSVPWKNQTGKSVFPSTVPKLNT